MYKYTCINIYIIIKTMCALGYHHNGFVATHARAHIELQVEITYNYK